MKNIPRTTFAVATLLTGLAVTYHSAAEVVLGQGQIIKKLQNDGKAAKQSLKPLPLPAPLDTTIPMPCIRTQNIFCGFAPALKLRPPAKLNMA